MRLLISGVMTYKDACVYFAKNILRIETKIKNSPK